MTQEHVVVTVMGCDQVGIVARISGVLAECQANIIDISQTILKNEIFAMILLIDISNSPKKLVEIQEALEKAGNQIGVKVVAQHEDIFRYMHRI